MEPLMTLSRQGTIMDCALEIPLKKGGPEDD